MPLGLETSRRIDGDSAAEARLTRFGDCPALTRRGKTQTLRLNHFAHGRRVMDFGNIVEDGPPGEVFTNPRSPRTRQFLQSILNRNGAAETAA